MLKFIIGKRVWAEDDATFHQEGHEGLHDAWARITGTSMDYAVGLVAIDRGDYDENIVLASSGRVFIVGSGPDGYDISEATFVKET